MRKFNKTSGLPQKLHYEKSLLSQEEQFFVEKLEVLASEIEQAELDLTEGDFQTATERLAVLKSQKKMFEKQIDIARFENETTGVKFFDKRKLYSYSRIY